MCMHIETGFDINKMEKKKEKQPENVRWFVCLVSVAARVFEEEKKKVKKEKMRTMGKDSESKNSR